MTDPNPFPNSPLTRMNDTMTATTSPRRRLVEAAVTLVSGEPAGANNGQRRRATRAQAYGAEAVGIRAVAESAGLTHAAPLHHFPDRVSLLAAVAAEGFRQLRADLEGATRLAASDAARRRLQAVVRAQALWAARHPGLWDVMCSPQLTAQTAAVWRGRRASQSAADALATTSAPAPASVKARARQGEAFDELVDAKLAVVDAFRQAVDGVPTAELVEGRSSIEARRALVNALTTMADGLSMQFVAEREVPADVLAAHADATVDVLLAGVVSGFRG